MSPPKTELTPSPSGASNHISSIDGVRGFAIFCVVMFHGMGMGEPYQVALLERKDILGWFGRVVANGYSGVELFFVLSGFCLAYPFLSRPDRKDDWVRYFANRIRRIFPPYIISFLLFSLVSRVLLRLKIEPYTMANFLYEPFNPEMWIKILTLTKESSMIGSHWTLPLEWRWYFLFPLVLILSRHVSPWALLLASVAAGYIALTYGDGGQFYGSFIGVTAFLPLFTLGVVAAKITARRVLIGNEGLSSLDRVLIRFAPIGIIIGFLVSLLAPSAGKGASALMLSFYWGLLFFSLIMWAVHHPLAIRIFSWRPIIFIGFISYSIYLVQEPVIRAISLLSYGRQHGDLRVTLTNFVLSPALCVLAGWIFHLVAERPFLRTGGKNSASSDATQKG